MGLQRFRAHCPRHAIWQDPAAPCGVLFVRPTAHRTGRPLALVVAKVPRHRPAKDAHKEIMVRELCPLNAIVST
jgi:hypothetical protein